MTKSCCTHPPRLRSSPHKGIFPASFVPRVISELHSIKPWGSAYSFNVREKRSIKNGVFYSASSPRIRGQVHEASFSVGSGAGVEATALTDGTSCHSGFWVCAHWAVTIANRAWRFSCWHQTQRCETKTVRCQPRWHVGDFHSISLR